MLRRILRVLAWVVVVLLVLAGAATAYAWSRANASYHRMWTTHNVSFPIPFPSPDGDASAAMPRAIASGKRLVDTRLGCYGCHGQDYGGKAIIDSTLVAHWIAPNLTSGKGSVTTGFTANDWDRAVRHGVRRSGESSSMPSQEFLNLTDHELSDVVAYITSLPPVDRDLGKTSLGLVFSFVVAFDPKALAAPNIDHQRPHAVEPPAAAISPEFGGHLAQVCKGCHQANLSGGPMQDPNMPMVANITPHETGLKDWTEADFIRALREGKRKDGTAIKDVMPWRAFGQMRDEEIKAIYAYLRTVPPLPKGTK